MKGTKRIAFSLLALALVGMQFMVVPVVPARAISTADYDGPPVAGTFTYNRNTTYLYNFSYTISTIFGGAFTTNRYIPMITNRTILSESGLVQQQEFVTTNISYDPYVTHVNDTDDFGNEFHHFDLNVAVGTTWAMNVQGRLTLRDITWNAQPGVTMASYNKTDPMYALYTKEEFRINKSHPLILGNATLLNSSNPYTTATNVYNFVKNFLPYNGSMDGEFGAEYAIEHKTGDCTEFSYLMVALLRACGIPARVLRGIVIADSAGAAVSPDFDAAVGTHWGFSFETVDTTLIKDTTTGHAWVEYFIPGAGWILSDPTWHNAGNYISHIDNVHVPYVVGVWIGQGLNPPLIPAVDDMLYPPYPFYWRAGVNQAVRYDFTVLSQQAPPTWWDQLLDFFVKNPWAIVLIVGLIAVVIVVVVVRKRRKSGGYSDSGSYRERVTFSS